MSYAHPVRKGRKVRLSEIDPAGTAGLEKAEALARTEALGAELAELVDLLYYAGRNALLIVLQGRDTSGKDGTIRRILDYVNAQSCRVEPFRVPTPLELSHDFLWRVHARVPPLGGIVIFNRSHYEDVLVPRVHSLVPEEVWRRRYAHINHFEELLRDSGTLLVKLFLHISPEEQEKRLREREEETEKAWKLSVRDWQERERWDDYTAAYEEMLARCSPEGAPWHVVPADRKWFRNLAVLEQVVGALRPRREEWLAHLAEIGRVAKAEIDAYRRR